MTHTPKQTDVQGRGVMLRLEPETVAHDWDTGVKDLCLPGPRTCFASAVCSLSSADVPGASCFQSIAQFQPEES